MHRSRRRPPPPPANDVDQPETGRWTRLGVGIEIFGFGALFLAGLLSVVRGAIRWMTGAI